METRRSLFGRLLGPLCCGLLLFILMLLDGSASSEMYAVDVELKDASNITCLYAKWMMNFSITYESNISEYKNKAFMLPENVRYDGSSCNGTNGPLLAIEFGEGHFWSINFAKTDDTYQGNITFIYNTNDAELFPDAKRKGLITASAKYPLHPIQLHTVFSCHHVDSVKAGNVTNDFWNITLQAFLQNGSLSTAYTYCDKDIVATTAENAVSVPTATTTEPTTAATVTTTTVPTTTTTTTIPTTSSTVCTTTTTTAAASVKTTLSPTPPPTAKTEEKPMTGNYSVNVGTTVCLLASMGLQLNVSKEQVPLIINIQPNTTVVTGNCGKRSADLRLNDRNSTIIDFFFAVKNTSSEKFYLKGVNVTVIRPANGSLYAANNSLSYWDASLGSSYMCKKEETLVVTKGYRIKTFDLRVQPFDVKENKYSTAQECSIDDDTILIPIAVGTALVILIVIIVFAYLIGRRKGYGGYQTL
ncbi:lysosome-associated membrane glycoprotein 2 isoform X2 [Eublepharis macularius]|uniref:Lysosome-associated membrane glycoprotein 2 n=1 Tax=Eublepharis macularius TaxID=481883 RepID=A0AA97KB33_EUBMA|nr:lysosome-associated membrane glycoprotein 2 isoform X2 [Eublepharis macularius]